jgi:hypothetical protein
MQEAENYRFFERTCGNLDIIIGKKCNGQTINISLNGMLASVNCFVKRGSKINILISFGVGIKLKGVCTRCEKLSQEDEYIVAVNFDQKMSESVKKQLSDAINGCADV